MNARPKVGIVSKATTPKVAWSALAASFVTVLIAVMAQHVANPNQPLWPDGAKCSPAGACSCYVEISP